MSTFTLNVISLILLIALVVVWSRFGDASSDSGCGGNCGGGGD